MPGWLPFQVEWLGQVLPDGWEIARAGSYSSWPRNWFYLVDRRSNKHICFDSDERLPCEEQCQKVYFQNRLRENQIDIA